MTDLREFWNEEDGMGTVEMVLIIAALVAVALLFRNKIIEFIQTSLEKVFKGADTGTSTGKGTELPG